MYEGTKVSRKEMVNYLKSTFSNPIQDCPNHAPVLTTRNFETSATVLAEPFSKAVEAYYAKQN